MQRRAPEERHVEPGDPVARSGSCEIRPSAPSPPRITARTMPPTAMQSVYLRPPRMKEKLSFIQSVSKPAEPEEDARARAKMHEPDHRRPSAGTGTRALASASRSHPLARRLAAGLAADPAHSIDSAAAFASLLDGQVRPVVPLLRELGQRAVVVHLADDRRRPPRRTTSGRRSRSCRWRPPSGS